MRDYEKKVSIDLNQNFTIDLLLYHIVYKSLIHRHLYKQFVTFQDYNSILSTHFKHNQNTQIQIALTSIGPSYYSLPL